VAGVGVVGLDSSISISVGDRALYWGRLELEGHGEATKGSLDAGWSAIGRKVVHYFPRGNIG
jgi:hypothetical protein